MVKLPEKFRSSQPMKMPSRALPSTTTPRQPPPIKGTSQPANAGARSPRLTVTVLPKKFQSSQPMKMPSRALPSATTPRQPPSLKGKSQQAAPKLGGELPPMKPVRKRPVQVVSNMAAPYGSKGGMTSLRNPMSGNPRRPPTR